MSKKAASLGLALLLISFFTAVSMASWINTDYGNIKVQNVLIPADGFSLEGLLYIHPEAHPDNPKPAILVTHGISNAKEAVSGIALELAREGFVALVLDLAGHGTSGGRLSVDDPSFGVVAALEYLRSLDYVDRGMMILVGHSLGAGAVRRVADGFGVQAVVFIEGGIGGGSEEGTYSSLSPTFPRNLLVVVGVNDILFDLEELDANLRPVFDAKEVIVPGKLYGDFMMGTLRRLVTPTTIHLLSPWIPSPSARSSTG
jgi:dienelactone hydrolase